MISFLLLLQRLFCSVCLFIVSSKAQYMVFCYDCDIFDSLLPAWLLNCLLISWHLGLLGNTDRNQCCVIMNESAVSQRWIFLLLWHHMSVRMHTHTHTNTHLLFLSLTLPLLLYFEDALHSFYLSVSVRMLFVHQTNHLLKLCVFLRTPSPWHTASHGGALPIIWCARDAQREPLPTAQAWSLCVHTR